MTIHTQCPAPSPTTPLTLTLLWNFDHGRAWLPLLLFLLVSPATAQLQNQLPPPPPDPFTRLKLDKTMAFVLVILVVVFFILGFLSMYTRQCAQRRIRARLDLAIPIISVGGSQRRPPRGLDSEIIDNFPTFVYSAVKSLKIGRSTLECAVCLNEFRDDETLRLIPKCSHVFHPDCIDVWLATHSTCPVCRANLVPKPGDMTSSVATQIPDPDGVESNRTDPEQDREDPNSIARVDFDDRNRVLTESPRVNLDNQNRPVRSKSTGFGIGSLFPRSHSTGHSLVRPGESCERFTLRLPEEVRNRLVNSASTLSRTKSCGVTLQRESSARRGYRTRSMGRSYMQYERFGGESRTDRWGFTWTPPFVGRTGSTKSTKDANKASVAMDEVDVEERSSDRLFCPRSED